MADREDAKLALRRAILTRAPQHASRQSGGLVAEHSGEARRFGAAGDQGHRANWAARIHRADNRRYISVKMTRAGHKLDQVLVQLAQCQSIACGEARNV